MLIAIDDGHGMETSGKRTPLFPGTNIFMRENEFNSAVAQLLGIELKRCGFETVFVALGDKDIPLAERVRIANSADADLYISIHANALTGEWGPHGGIETYHYPNSQKGKQAAEIIHRHLLHGTPLVDRGVKTANFYVLKHTKMPAVLVECGFMDNIFEAQLLLSGAYRKECAVEIAQGICEYSGVEYVYEKTELDEVLDELGALIARYKRR